MFNNLIIGLIFLLQLYAASVILFLAFGAFDSGRCHGSASQIIYCALRIRSDVCNTKGKETQMANCRRTSAKVASVASRALRSNATSVTTKKLAGTAMSQRAGCKHCGKH